jgi:hypothetical protein
MDGWLRLRWPRALRRETRPQELLMILSLDLAVGAFCWAEAPQAVKSP